MTDSQTPTYRSHTTPTGDHIEYRQPDEDADVFEVRMPIATTGEVRNKGDDPLTRDELDGMARQINDGGLGVFLDHGGSDLGGAKPYSAIGKIGEWTDATLDSERDDGEDALEATARLMDPESLPEGVNDLRAAVGAIKEQVKRDFSISSSIGWREDESYPGGNDLMEASIVGIGADPRTTSQATDDAGLVARAAVEAGADREELVATVREAVGGERDSDSEATQDMTDDDTGDDAGTTDEEQNAQDADEEFREFMREQTEQQTEILQSLSDALREDDEDEDEGDTDDEENEGDTDDEEEDDEDEQSADTDEEQSVDEDLSERVAELESMLDEAREDGFAGVESPGGDDEADAEQDADDSTSDELAKYNIKPN